jgi:tetratricopeptide (TPR) repeat protein
MVKGSLPSFRDGKTSGKVLPTGTMAKASSAVNASRSLWIAFFLYASMGGWAPDARAELYVVAVGIKDYKRVGELDSVGSADTDAREFQSFIQDRWKSKAYVTLLDGPRATKYSVANAVYLNLTKAGVNDSVFLFISARGFTARDGAGYILTYESQLQNGAGTGVSIDYFRLLLQGRHQPSGRFYLFADVCRQPKDNSKPKDNSNWIQRSLKGLATDSLDGILATKPDVPSKDRVFRQALLEAMRETHWDPQREFDLLFDEVKKKAGRQQEPDKLPKTKRITLYRSAPRFNRYPGEIALLGSPIPLLFAMQTAGSTERLRVQFREALTNEKLITPGGAFDLLKALRSVEPQAAAAEDTILLLTELESRGQAVIADYGSGEQFPNDPMKLDAAQFLQAADYFEHASMLERPERKDEIDSRTWFCKGRAKLFDGPAQDIDGAAGDLEKAVKLYPGFPEPYNGLGIIHLVKAQSGRGAQPGRQPVDFSAAVAAFRKAIEIAPLWAYSRHNLALTYTQSGEFRKAGNEYKQAIQRTPFHPYLQYNLALLLQNQNRLREAEQQYKSAMAVFLTLIDKHIAAQASAAKLGAAVGADSRYYQAQSVREQQIVDALKRNLAETYNALGTLRENRSDSAGAEEYYKDALAKADLLEARHNLALLYMSRRDKSRLAPVDRLKLVSDAEGLWRLNLSREPEHRPSLLGLARAYRAEDNLEEAIRYYQRILNLDPEQIAAREELALSLAKAGRKDDAARELAETIRRQQAARSSAFANPALHEELGNLYWDEKRAGDACRQYCLARRAQQAGLRGASDLKEKLRRCPSGCPAK